MGENVSVRSDALSDVGKAPQSSDEKRGDDEDDEDEDDEDDTKSTKSVQYKETSSDKFSSEDEGESWDPNQHNNRRARTQYSARPTRTSPRKKKKASETVYEYDLDDLDSWPESD
jgi:hypothetical protein